MKRTAWFAWDHQSARTGSTDTN